MAVGNTTLGIFSLLRVFQLCVSSYQSTGYTCTRTNPEAKRRFVRTYEQTLTCFLVFAVGCRMSDLLFSMTGGEVN